jgi:hypothetical protein
MAENFIVVHSSVSGPTAIAISQISSVKPDGTGTLIVLKEIKNGSNAEVYTSAAYSDVIKEINRHNQ